MTVNPVNPTTAPDPVGPGGGRWCEEHGRYECTRAGRGGFGNHHAAAVKGTDVCKNCAGQTLASLKAKGEANLLMQQAAASSERTHPAVVLLDACQLAYDLMQQAAQGQAEGLDPDAAKALWDRLEGSVDRAARIAKAALDADAQDRHVRAVERRVGVAADVVDGVLRAFVEGLGLEWGSDGVQDAVVAALGEG